MINKLREKLKNLEDIKNSIDNSNDIGINVKQYIYPILENDINIIRYKISKLENIQFFNIK